MSDIAKRLRASVGHDAINGDSFERSVCASQMIEAADTIDRLNQEIAELREDVHTLEDARPNAAKMLAKHQPCGCIVCTCDHDQRCLGCGARHCGTHAVGEIPSPAYVDELLPAGYAVENQGPAIRVTAPDGESELIWPGDVMYLLIKQLAETKP